MSKLSMVWWENESVPSSLYCCNHDLLVAGPYPHSLGSFTTPIQRWSHWGTRVIMPMPQKGLTRTKRIKVGTKVCSTNVVRRWLGEERRQLKESGWWNRERWRRCSWSEESGVWDATANMRQHCHLMLLLCNCVSNKQPQSPHFLIFMFFCFLVAPQHSIAPHLICLSHLTFFFFWTESHDIGPNWN